MNKYLNRQKIYTKLEAAKNAKKLYVFCEGEKTEVNYFHYFKGFSANIDIIPIPPTNGQTDPVKLKESAESYFLKGNNFPSKLDLDKEYKDEVWFVIDTDRWNEGNKIEQLRDFCDEINQRSQYNQWTVAQSNPSFEIWLFYHFNPKKPVQQEVDNFNSFKHFVHHNIRGGNGFNPNSHPVEIEIAIENTQSNFESMSNQPSLYSTEVYKLGQIILSFVKPELDKIKKMTELS